MLTPVPWPDFWIVNLSEPVCDQLFTRVGWNEATIREIPNFVNGARKRADRVDGILFMFNASLDRLIDKRGLVNSIHWVIGISVGEV